MKKKIWRILAICSFVLALLLVGIFGMDYYQKWQAERDYAAMQNQNTEFQDQQKEEIPTPTVTQEAQPSVTAEPTLEATPEVTPEVTPSVDIPIDFASLWEKNTDIYAWIRIPGTVIDYPVVQRSSNNNYYLNHSATKKKSYAGAIFSENYNTLTFEDYITVLYGHNMRSGSMFAGLHAYSDDKYMKEHNEILVYTPTSVLKYKIFAAYLTDNRHMLLSYNHGREAENRIAYINDIFNQRSMHASIDKEAPVDENSKILTLSTCHGSGKQYRYLVQAYLVEEQ